jgi:hypothetical protein
VKGEKEVELSLPPTNILFTRYKIRLKVRDKVYGFAPADLDVVIGWLIGRGVPKEVAEELGPEIAKTIDTKSAEKIKEKLKKSKINFVVFQKDEKGLFMEERHIKGMLKEFASLVGYNKKWPQNRVKSFIAHNISVMPRRIYFMRNGEIVKEPDGWVIRTAKVLGAKGPRNVVKGMFYIEKPEIEFELIVNIPSLEEPVIDDEKLVEMFKRGEENGILGDRTLGEGKFDVVYIKKINDAIAQRKKAE